MGQKRKVTNFIRFAVATLMMLVAGGALTAQAGPGKTLRAAPQSISTIAPSPTALTKQKPAATTLRPDELAPAAAYMATQESEPLITGALRKGQTNGTAGGNAGLITNIRLGDQGDETRFVLELSGSDTADYVVFTLSNPWRVVIDIKDAPIALAEGAVSHGLGLVQGYRYGRYNESVSRVVIDTHVPVAMTRNFVLDPQGGFGRRIVIDLKAVDIDSFTREASQTPPSSPENPVPVANGGDVPVMPVAAPMISTAITPVARPEPPRSPSRKVVVIDAGHGGVDPGTHSRSGVNEKDVVLAFAKEFADKLKSTGRYDVFLTRDRDIFIPLRQRVAIARHHNADLFISIHADSIKKSDVRGMSIYTLSETSSDKEAAALAAKENQSDLIAGIDLQGESPEVTGILIDLAQRETKNYSSRFARSIVDYAKGTTSMLDPAHRFAGFVVLKAPDVPSVLVELGFLTNRSDEKQLTSSKWRRNTAATFTRAVDRYFGERVAEGPN